MDMLVFIIICFVLVLVYIITESGIELYKEKIKYEEEHRKIITEIKFKQTNFDNDFKLLNDTIDSLCSEISLTELREFIDSKRLVNDDTFDQLSKNLTHRIIELLSDAYLDLLETYIDEIEVYIYQKVYFKVLAIVMETNSSNIKRINRGNRF